MINMVQSIDDSQYDFSSGYSAELMDIVMTAGLTKDNSMVNSIQQDMCNVLMARVREEILKKEEELKIKTATYPHSRPVLDMLLKRLYVFATENLPYKFKPIIYHLELAHKLERIDWENHDIGAFSPVDELLIYMNFNSKAYIKMLECWLSERIEESDNPMERLLTMHYYQKAFSQLHRKPNIVLHEDYLGLTEVLDNWFNHETQYLENHIDLWVRAKEIQPKVTETKPEPKPEPKDRIEWSLSGDQIALLLRAADDTRIIKAKSMRSVFNKVIPHVKTPFSDSLSPAATRSAAYQAEQTDKDHVVSFLKKMIKRIEEY